MKKKILKKGKFFQYNDTGGRQIENATFINYAFVFGNV